MAILVIGLGIFPISGSAAETAARAAPAPVAVYPIDLATALRLAGAKSVDIQIARERLQAAKGNATSAATQFLPWFSATANYRRHGGLIQDVVGNIVEADKTSYALGGAINLFVDVGDAFFRTLAARQASHAAEQGLMAQRQETLVRAAQAYFDLLVAQAVVGVAREALQISQDYESQLHRAVDAGIALKGDELRVRVQTRRNQLFLQQATEQRRILAARLAEALRLDPGVELVAQDLELAPLALVQAPEAVDVLVSEALSARPELREAQALLQVAEQTEKGAVYGPLIPTIVGQAFFGGLGGGKENSPTSFGGSRDYLAAAGWRFGPGGLFDVGRIRSTRARREEARWNLEKLKDIIALQVVEARTRLLSQQEQLETAKDALVAAEQGLELARGRKEFEVGVVLENILAEQDQTRARQDYVRAIGEYDKAQYGLSRALGRLGNEGPGQGSSSTPPKSSGQ
ncbi:MAG TPA: TolC family protein [Vicinamibacteria bacterium]|nr:TolC family protein [Vicinamibacteria bacterium]